MFDLQRCKDLLRFCRHKLHEEELISDEEYSELLQDHKAVERLEGYDVLRAKNKRLREVLKSLISEEMEPGTWAIKCIEDHNAIIKEALGDTI